MLKLGSILLSLWSVFNLLPSTWILVSILFRGGNAPGLTGVLTEAQVRALGAEALAAANSIAVFANGLNAAFCLLFAVVVWQGLVRRSAWAFWALSASALVALLAGVGADHVVGTRFPEVNVVSGLLLAAGSRVVRPRSSAGPRPDGGDVPWLFAGDGPDRTVKRSTLLAAIVLLGGTVLQAVLWSRQWIYGDQYALFLAGLDLLETGRLPPVAKYMSGGGHIPGSLLPLLIAGPLEAWTDYRAPALLIGVGHLAAAGVLAATVGRALGISFLAAYLAAYWLSPWRLYHAGFVWEPAYVFLPAALHLACAWRLRAGRHFGWSLLLAATLTATLQLHASFVVLVVLTALLALQGAIRVDWRGAFAGVASGALTLIPTAQAWLAGTLPRMAPGRRRSSRA